MSCARPLRSWIGVAVLGGIFLVLSTSTGIWHFGLALLFPDTRTLLYPRADPAWLVG